jgi:hypothetical protein
LKILAIIALLLLGSCISANYVRFSTGEPVGDEELEGLRPGNSDLGACLAQLGAPHLVWQASDKSIAMAYAWLDQGDWGVGLSYSLEQFVSVRLSYDSSAILTEAAVLIFDQNLQLIAVKRGLLSEFDF